jgi:hypothetical protein
MQKLKDLETRDGKIQATKHDSGKIKLGLYPTRAFLATSEVFTYGAEKYSEGNWHQGDGFKYSRLADAAKRHILAFELGVELDDESNLHVLAHAACEIAMLLEMAITRHGLDDRAIRQHDIFQKGCDEEVKAQYERYDDGDLHCKYNPPKPKS